MKVSCLVVTQEARWEHFQRACRYFLRQTWSDKELVVAAYGSPDYLDRLARYCRELPAATATAFTTLPTPLGQLRNLSVQAAGGDIVCQWDDDDQYHPRRLEIQTQALVEQSAEFSLLSDYWHYFADTGELYWVDCRCDAAGQPWPIIPPLQTLHGTLMARRAVMLAYPREQQGEDSRLIMYAAIKQRKFALVQGAGWCYVYAYHGGNTWDRQHHDEYVRNRSRVRLIPTDADTARQTKTMFNADMSIAQVLSQYELGDRLNLGKVA